MVEAPPLPPAKTVCQRHEQVNILKASNTIIQTINLLLFLLFTVFAVRTGSHLITDQNEHKLGVNTQSMILRVQSEQLGGWRHTKIHICTSLNPLLNISVAFHPLGQSHPGFISNQVSSCPAFGASTPVRMFPLSTWITFTGRSLIWLVSSRGCGRGGESRFYQTLNVYWSESIR